MVLSSRRKGKKKKKAGDFRRSSVALHSLAFRDDSLTTKLPSFPFICSFSLFKTSCIL